MSKQSSKGVGAELDELDRILQKLVGSPLYVERLVKAKFDLAQYIKQKELEARYALLEELLEWHDSWIHIRPEQPFNWHGAVKAMLVMKNPRKPFTHLEREINE